MLKRELLEEYVENELPEAEYGKPSLELYLFIYDSYEYRAYVFKKSLDNLKNCIFER
jgi:hypothetical protein